MSGIQMVDLKSQYLKIKEEVDVEIQKVIDSSGFINGRQVKKFSSNLEDYLGVKKVVPCGNGTDALQIALMAFDFKPGDEVIVPAFTYAATVEVIALLQLVPVFVDVDPNSFNIDISKIEAVVTSKTVAIIPVHLFGQCAEMTGVMKLAKTYNLKVIEDAAQALGSQYTHKALSRSAGCIGDIGTTSFFPSKNLGCFGDGGALMINDEVLAEKVSQIANHGQREKYHHDLVGVNSRLDTIQAAVLNVKLKYLDEYISQRQVVAVRYDSAFKNVDGIDIPIRMDYSSHSFHQYTLKVPDGSRDKLKDHLKTIGVPSMIYYPVPGHLQKAYERFGYLKGDFPISETLCRNVISLPIDTEMHSDQQTHIINSVEDFFDK